MKKSILFIIFITAAGKLSAQIPLDLKFESHNLVLNTPTGDIYGTLTIPETGKDVPVVLIVSGSGATDRDGNSPENGINNNCYKMIAEDFARKGIASLRYDKRGVGESLKSNSGPAHLFEDYIADLKAWVVYLKQTNLFSGLIILGHGEGSLVGMIAAGNSGADAFISAEGSGMSYDKALLHSLRNSSRQVQIEARKILDNLMADKRVDTISQQLSVMLHPSIHPYIKSAVKYDPSLEISKLKIPVMILHGNYDLVVPVENANILAKAKPDAQFRIIRNMNYILKDTDEDEEYNRSSYRKPYLPLNKELMGALINFIQSLKYT